MAAVRSPKLLESKATDGVWANLVPPKTESEPQIKRYYYCLSVLDLNFLQNRETQQSHGEVETLERDSEFQPF